ncbi:MAG TPA: DUF2851 family protein [Flavipsychrobacter sp.]|nr:DUF2851 family protein [Flavipsychrobacter sp.]
MNEMLFQFIWQYSLYNPVGLQTTNGEAITVIHPGKRHTNAGPDFEEARIKIGDTILVGNVELHIKTSDWNKHHHSSDQKYQNIILHVVYKDDVAKEEGFFEKMELEQHIPDYVIKQYTNLIQTTQPIACARQLTKVNSIVKESWLNRLLAERWEQKLKDWTDTLEQSAGDWRNLLYWRMAANFGFKVNATPFLMLARSLPVNILAKHKESMMQIEALLFGQAGMLDSDFEEAYPNELKKEYQYLKQKYKLQPIAAHLWRFMRMRPPNFPTVRIAQFAGLVHKSLHLFSQIVEKGTAKEVYPLLQVTASAYWTNHYRFDEIQKRAYPKALGADSIDNIIINTIAPVQFLYAHYHGTAANQESALQLLSSVNAESNNIVAIWNEHNWMPENAAQSQALIQLFNNYCSNKRCLECSIGLGIIKSRPIE